MDEETRARYRRWLGWLVLALVLGYAGLEMPMPWRVVTIVASLAGVIGAIVLLVKCLRAKAPAMLSVSAVVVMVCCGFFLLSAVMQAIFWNASVEFDECLRTAVTERATNACYEDYEQSITSLQLR
ncbi:cytochrome d ubiquinol oxidase subunit II [Nesterenkonia sp. MY13]|uniref:Cytochrome d ubiquinol oxidase subunit II n=1 Tax=Nesterenkonia sedimenti TaxID=1463632 RepID=A0A7X8YE11_9MICC|nr:cytochrome d ubiquinol oxidase subunit II [Nesterenkonia sedimenti]NLS10000.1 cytochrome d ubiquinol oxidase subunit II [Nesterenkonia sedimenti]